MEQRRSHTNGKGNVQAEQTSVRQNTDDVCEVGLSHSSEETSVMGVERRAEVVQLELSLTTNGDVRRTKEVQTRGIPITQGMVLEAFKKVRSNKGSSGVDKETIEMYEEKLKDNLYVLWNRLSSGTYFAPAVREVSIDKSNGKKRKLGIPTVNDRIAQEVIKRYLEPRLEREFSESSYGYRPLKNTHQAVEQVRKNTRKYAWVIDMDISGFFDNLSHEKMLLAINRHVSERWLLSYCARWLKAPIQGIEKELEERDRGTPQGGVISPLLANLFLHYVFDRWFELNFPSLSFVRYADDIVVHCHNEEEAKHVLSLIKSRLSDCELSLNEEKSKIVFCKTANRVGSFKNVKFDFLGFSFQPRTSANKQTRELFLGYDCAISRKSETSICKELRRSEFHRWTHLDIHAIAKHFNPILRGWLNYYGKFKLHLLDRIFGMFNWRLIKWAMKKYKRFKESMYDAGDWIRRIALQYPYLFVHWQHGFGRA